MNDTNEVATQERQGDETHRASNSGLVHFRVMGTEGEEQLVDMVSSMLSAVKKCGFGPAAVAEQALRRVAQLDESYLGRKMRYCDPPEVYSVAQ